MVLPGLHSSTLELHTGIYRGPPAIRGVHPVTRTELDPVYAELYWDPKQALGRSCVNSSLHQESTTIPSSAEFDSFREIDAQGARYLPSSNFRLPSICLHPWRSLKEA